MQHSLLRSIASEDGGAARRGELTLAVGTVDQGHMDAIIEKRGKAAVAAVIKRPPLNSIATSTTSAERSPDDQRVSDRSIAHRRWTQTDISELRARVRAGEGLTPIMHALQRTADDVAAMTKRLKLALATD